MGPRGHPTRKEGKPVAEKVVGRLTLEDLEAHLYSKVIEAVDAGDSDQVREWLKLLEEAGIL